MLLVEGNTHTHTQHTHTQQTHIPNARLTHITQNKHTIMEESHAGSHNARLTHISLRGHYLRYFQLNFI